MLFRSQAQIQGAQTMQDAAAEAGLLEQQEQLAAQQAFLSAAGQVRGQDIQRAQTEAQLAQQANLAGAEMAQQRALTQDGQRTSVYISPQTYYGDGV